MEISINSPKTVKEFHTGTGSVPTEMSPGGDKSLADQATPSSTASCLSDELDTAEAETETPRSFTPDSSVDNGEGPGRNKLLSLSGLWTEKSEKVC